MTDYWFAREPEDFCLWAVIEYVALVNVAAFDAGAVRDD